MPESADTFRDRLPSWLRRPSPWLFVPAAVLLGLLLFLVVWLVQRPAAEADGEVSTLPAIAVEADARGASLPAPQLPEPAIEGAPSAEGEGGGIFVLPDAPAEPPQGIAGQPPLPADPVPEQAEAAEAVAVAVDREPVSVRQPQPGYPRRALRDGLAGEVLVRAVVGTDGRPRQVEIARSSSHRVLDQAALQAVRRWRFEPALREGQPVAHTVHVPFQFNP